MYRLIIVIICLAILFASCQSRKVSRLIDSPNVIDTESSSGGASSDSHIPTSSEGVSTLNPSMASDSNIDVTPSIHPSSPIVPTPAYTGNISSLTISSTTPDSLISPTISPTPPGSLTNPTVFPIVISPTMAPSPDVALPIIPNITEVPTPVITTPAPAPSAVPSSVPTISPEKPGILIPEATAITATPSPAPIIIAKSEDLDDLDERNKILKEIDALLNSILIQLDDMDADYLSDDSPVE